MQPGGQLTITTEVENYPGFAEAIQGPWLMEQMEQQAEHVGTRFLHDTIVEVDLSRRPFRCIGDSGDVYLGDTLVISHRRHRALAGHRSERRLQGFGVSACATCDGFFFRNKQVAVVGGGNTAVEEAIYLAGIASQVTLIHRRDRCAPKRSPRTACSPIPRSRCVWDSAVDEILGGGSRPAVTGVRLKESRPARCPSWRPTACSSPSAIRPTPSCSRASSTLDAEGYIVTAPGSTAHQRCPGVFAAGDVQDKIFRQAVTAAGTGCMAALEAERFLAGAWTYGRSCGRIIPNG